jgi:2-polyprenyl-6-methoxyphenol hydroxylase-like FAD-dependent oxidoreductase
MDQDAERGPDYDVLIVGARVAGASLALLLGQRGHRVLLIDRDTFPSDTLSTHFVGGPGLGALRQLGVLADVEAVGFRRLTRNRTWVEDCLFEGPAGPAGAYELAPRRDALDDILIRHARERGGVEFQERTHADGLHEEDGRVAGAYVRTTDGERRLVRARVVVGADGKYSKVAEWVKAERYEAVPAQRPVYYGYFHGVAPLPEPALELFFVRDQIGFIFPMRPDEDCLALEVQPTDFDAFRADPRAVFEERFRALPGMAARLAGARLEDKLFGVRGIENCFRKPYGPGWALAGDAGYVKDPSTGFGIGDAVSQAFPLAEALDAALRGADWEASLGGFQRARDEALLPMYRFTLGATQLRDAPPETIAWLRAAVLSPHLTRQIMYWLPSALATALPAHLQPMVRTLAGYLGAPPDVVPAAVVPPTHA